MLLLTFGVLPAQAEQSQDPPPTQTPPPRSLQPELKPIFDPGPPHIVLDSGWACRWGESPLDEAGIPLWTFQDLESPRWRPIEKHVNLPREGTSKFIWLRVPLPAAGPWEAPVLFLPRVYMHLEVYLGPRLIYAYGEMRDSASIKFGAFSPHLIPLPADFQEKTLFVKIFSSSPRLNGIDGKVRLGSQGDMVRRIVRSSFLQLLVGVISVLIGIFSLLTYLDRSVRGSWAPACLGLFALMIGLTFLGLLPVMNWLAPAPGFWYFAVFASFGLFPVPLIAFVEQMLESGPKRFVRRFWQAHLAVVTVLLALDVLQISTVPSWGGLMMFVWAADSLLLGTVAVMAAFRKQSRARLLSLGIIAFAIFSLLDIYRKGKDPRLMPIGTLIFIGVLAWILVRRFTENSRRLKLYSEELEENSQKLAAARDQLEEYSRNLEEKVAVRTRELREKQSQLVQSSKMASLGSLVAGVAHEINTPVGAISSMHNTLIRAVDRMKHEIETGLKDYGDQMKRLKAPLNVVDEANKVIRTGTERVIDIVKRLRSFARLDEAELKEADIHEGLEDTLTIIHHEIKHMIEIIRNYGDVPRISCYPGRLNQVFLNLLINAKQSMEESGKITITTGVRGKQVHIEIRDTGHGIPQEKLGKIFDPGFTTKGVGVGTGLGLAICYQIIQDHRGQILVESEVGKGTAFTIILPMDLEAT